MPSLVVRQVAAEALVDLRHAVLRDGLPRETAVFDVDRLPGTFHLGGFIGDRLVTCATFTPNAIDGKPAMQLRGMATDAQFRGRGFGALVLAEGERRLSSTGQQLIWCNARLGAIPFYEKQGWEVISGVFDLPYAGPHKKMRKHLGP